MPPYSMGLIVLDLNNHYVCCSDFIVTQDDQWNIVCQHWCCLCKHSGFQSLKKHYKGPWVPSLGTASCVSIWCHYLYLMAVIPHDEISLCMWEWSLTSTGMQWRRLLGTTSHKVVNGTIICNMVTASISDQGLWCRYIISCRKNAFVDFGAVSILTKLSCYVRDLDLFQAGTLVQMQSTK